MLKILPMLTILLLAQTAAAEPPERPEVPYPCSVVLHPVSEIPNAQGMTLIAKVKKPFAESASGPLRERQSVGIYADWLPAPSSFGDYDRYEGLAQIPGEISWRIKLYPVKEDTPSWFGGTPWVGKFDEISTALPDQTRVEVRLSNSRTDKLGPIILQNTLQGCHN
ncbi:hypothetical protein LJK88_41535 [Paenibacillus sp. P26]|nr:hypothetical protein LJK88_41535 [Paenibacillus sp. P26]UUZ92721.1 hypothetical protein LJK87_46765 [Paenibacillus sp. P25]